METSLELEWPRIAAFMRHYAHELRNHLNGFDLEAALLAELVQDGEASASVARLRTQIRQLTGSIQSLTAHFADPRPNRSPIGAREIFLVFQDQVPAVAKAPRIEWTHSLGEESVNVDACDLARAVCELLTNARDFGIGATMKADARVSEGRVLYVFAEPKSAPINTEKWGYTPFLSTRRGGCGLGLLDIRRLVEASGGNVTHQYSPERKELLTTFGFDVAAAA